MKVGDRVVRNKGSLFVKDSPPATIIKQHAGNPNCFDIQYDDEAWGVGRFVWAEQLKLVKS